jgi:hypothetical protein
MRERAETTVKKFRLIPGEWEQLPTQNCLRLLNNKGHSVGVVSIPATAGVFEVVRLCREACIQAHDYIERYRYA